MNKDSLNWSSVDQLPIHESWKPILETEIDTIAKIGEFLTEEIAAGRSFLPAQDDIFRAFSFPFDDVKVVILGQDPYPTPGHAMGLSFSTNPGVKPLPRSLLNIFRELSDDLGIIGSTKLANADGDLSAWSRQGVALFNRVLTVQVGIPASHKAKGWEKVTETALKALSERDKPLVAILWGKQAQTCQKFLGDTPSICSAHPSPLSASRGFFGSRPFSRCNEILRGLGSTEINWQL